VTVSFTGSGTYTTIYTQTGNSYMMLNTGGNHRAGEIMTSASVLIGNSIKKLTVILKKAGSPTGTITVRVRKGTADSDGIIFGSPIDAATLTTTDQTFTLESPTSHTFAANDKVLVEWEGTGTSIDQVLVKRHNYPDAAASFDGINTRQAHKVATSIGYIGYNNADIAGVWSKLE
jgi:hypothetical protein